MAKAVGHLDSVAQPHNHERVVRCRRCSEHERRGEALVSEWFEQAAGRLAERSGETAADAATPVAKALFARVRARLAPDRYRGALLDGLQAEPDNTERQQILKSELAKLIAQAEFAAELARLVVEAEQTEGARVTATESGIVAGREVHQQGQYVAGRELTIGNMPEG